MQLSLHQQVSSIEEAVKNPSRNSEDVRKAKKAFLRLWDIVPDEWKSECKRPPSGRMRADEWKKDPIEISEEVLTQLSDWENDVSSILPLAAFPDYPEKDFAQRLLLALGDTHSQANIVGIRLRILQIMLHLFINKLGGEKLRTDSEREAEFYERANISMDYEKKTLEMIKKWATTGRKLLSFSLEFAPLTECLGPMICLPEDIGPYK